MAGDNGSSTTRLPKTQKGPDSARLDYEVLIIGAGIAGIGMAIELMKQGIDSFALLERADDVGGTWRDNRYPGIAVDITSLTYSFSYEQKPDWSRVFAPGSELQGPRRDQHDGLAHGRGDRAQIGVLRRVPGCGGELSQARR
jgi:cation diffusion facilitator CzcD-associated flavoprotein CzcO